MSREIVVVSNDVVPGMGVPVAAPGLRAWGIATGLRRLGHPVTLVVNAHVADKVRGQGIPLPRPHGTLVMAPSQVGDLIRSRQPKAVVLTNSNHFEAIGDVGGTRRVFDFFAPKVLELQENAQATPADLVALRARKLSALAVADAVVINGEKKTGYVRDWLTLAGRDPDSVPTAQLPTPLQVSPNEAPDDGPLHAIVSGYIQPWSNPGLWVEGIRPLLADGSLVLHLMVANHWGGGGRSSDLPEAFARLDGLHGVVQHGTLEYDDFRRVLSRCHVSLDVFARNPERELAMVTRTLVALSCGMPVVHVPFTETGLLVERFGAGWLVDGDDVNGVAAVLKEAATDRSSLERAREGVSRLCDELLQPEVATVGLHDLLEAM